MKNYKIILLVLDFLLIINTIIYLKIYLSPEIHNHGDAIIIILLLWSPKILYRVNNLI